MEEELLLRYLQESENRFQTEAKERKVQLPEHGMWEVALRVIDEIPVHDASYDFLNLLDVSHPRYTGWPVWPASWRFTDKGARPYIFQGAWEAFIILGSDSSTQIDFMPLDPKGWFYLRRPLREDVSDNRQASASRLILDVRMQVMNTAEAIAVGLAFTKAMGCPAENTRLSFAFKWTKLRGQELPTLLAQLAPDIVSEYSAYQDEVFIRGNTAGYTSIGP